MSYGTNPETPLTWDEPPGLAARGTVVVLPGRGERPGLYERFGRRLAAEAYRVRVVGHASADVDPVGVAVKALVEEADRPGPVVLVGSDTGALLALNDQVSPLDGVAARYAGLATAELLGVQDGRHDVLNAAHHRSVAASVVLWLERLRLGAQAEPVVARVEAAQGVPA